MSSDALVAAGVSRWPSEGPDRVPQAPVLRPAVKSRLVGLWEGAYELSICRESPLRPDRVQANLLRLVVDRALLSLITGLFHESRCEPTRWTSGRN